MGSGNIARRVHRLATKKTDAQLIGHPNSVLALSFWHQFGVSRDGCLRIRNDEGARRSGEMYAATYGKTGDSLFEESFAGEPDTEKRQGVDGILVASSNIHAVLWLFQHEQAVLFESARVTLDEEARDLIVEAFRLRTDRVSRYRRRPERDDIQLEAYYRWEKRGGTSAPDTAIDDWLDAERALAAVPR
jgi:hypothetical protein